MRETEVQACFVYITSASLEEAQKISRSLVQKKLAACTNVLNGMLSFYEWEGRLEEGQECILIAKSRPELFDKLKAEVLALHSYSCPCIVMLPLVDGHLGFIEWIHAQTQV